MIYQKFESDQFRTMDPTAFYEFNCPLLALGTTIITFSTDDGDFNILFEVSYIFFPNSTVPS